MQLLVIRHAIAEERETFAQTGLPDSERPLTDYGRRRMRRNARGLRRAIEPPNILATSPYIRAAQTAKIVADTLTISEIEVVEALTPEHHPRDLLTWLLRQDSSSTVGVVGHEPHLGILVTWLISSRAECNVELKKGGVCLLDLGNNPEPGKAVLRWLLTPGQLRSMVD